MELVWKIIYWGDRGEEYLHIKATSRDAAIRSSGLPSSRIIMVQLGWRWLREHREKISRPNKKDQIAILLNIHASCLTGNFDKAIDTILKTGNLAAMIKRCPKVLHEDLTLSRRLALLGFEKEVCAAIHSGEQTGQLAIGVAAAVQYLRQILALQNETSRQFYLSGVMVCFASAAFFILPPIMVNSLQPFMEIKEINFPATIATYLLLDLGSFIRDYGVWLGVALLFCIVLATVYQAKLRRCFPFSLFNELQKNRRSIRFIAAWTLYRLSGISFEADKDALYRILDSAVAQDVLSVLRRGESLCEAVTQQHFSSILVNAMPALRQFDNENLQQVSALLMENLSEEGMQKKKRVANICYISASIVSLSLIFLFAYGLVFPMLSGFSGFNL